MKVTDEVEATQRGDNFTPRHPHPVPSAVLALALAPALVSYPSPAPTPDQAPAPPVGSNLDVLSVASTSATHLALIDESINTPKKQLQPHLHDETTPPDLEESETNETAYIGKLTLIRLALIH